LSVCWRVQMSVAIGGGARERLGEYGRRVGIWGIQVGDKVGRGCASKLQGKGVREKG